MGEWLGCGVTWAWSQRGSTCRNTGLQSVIRWRGLFLEIMEEEEGEREEGIERDREIERER